VPNYTAKNALPYPLLTEAPDGPDAFQALAERIEAVWAEPRPIGMLKQTVQQNPASGNPLTITFGQAITNSGGMADLANSRLVAPVAGIYHLEARAAFVQGAVNTYRRVTLKVAGVDVNFGAKEEANVTGLATIADTSWVGPCNAGDAITAQLFHNNGAALGTSLTPYYCYLAGWLIQAS
jgi:hypothetical protein